MARFFLMIAAVSGFLAVIVGAFAAHGLKKMLAPEMIEVVKTGVQYQMYHALALLLVGLWLSHKPEASGLKAGGIAFILGTLLFSGSLYALALDAPRWLGASDTAGWSVLFVGLVALVESRMAH